MNTQTKVRVPLSDLTDEALERLEALYIRLLFSQTGRIAESLNFKLCEVRLAMFSR